MAGWNAGGGKLDLPLSPSPYVAQIADVKTIKGKDMGKGEKPRFQWTVDVWLGNAWSRKTVYTGTEFCDVSKISSAQFVPELIKLVRACGRPIPQSAQEADAWDPAGLIGFRFGIRMVEEDGLVQKKFVQAQVPQPAAAPVPQAHPMAQQAQPTAPVAAAPVQLPQPGAPVQAPPQAAPPPAYSAPPPAPPAPPPVYDDPFEGDAGAIPATPAPPHPAHMPPPVVTGADAWA